MKPLIWIIDEEWPDYDLETKMFQEKYPGCEIKITSTYEYEADLKSFGREADAILAQIYVRFPAEVIEQLTRCKAIAIYGGGFDRVDTRAAKAKGIKVTNVSGYCKEDLADYVMAAVYFFYKQVAHLSAEVKSLPWGAPALPNPPTRLEDSIMHIIGLGRIGLEVAKRALGNGLTVTAFDAYVTEEAMRAHGVRKVEWDEGLNGADYVSVNCILTEATTKLVKYDDFKKMKPTAFFINTSRGLVIDEDGMVRALNEGLIRGAMVDVIQAEPPTYQEKIFSCPNAYVTPHISYISNQSFAELKRRAISNAICGLEGGISPDLVNP